MEHDGLTRQLRQSTHIGLVHVVYSGVQFGRLNPVRGVLGGAGERLEHGLGVRRDGPDPDLVEHINQPVILLPEYPLELDRFADARFPRGRLEGKFSRVPFAFDGGQL
ncbi:hypothetical protein H4R33_004170, partial [Dimargaris cristalligena]